MRRQLQFNSHSLQTFDGIIQAVYENARHASDITEVKPTELTDCIRCKKEKKKKNRLKVSALKLQFGPSNRWTTNCNLM